MTFKRTVSHETAKRFRRSLTSRRRVTVRNMPRVDELPEQFTVVLTPWTAAEILRALTARERDFIARGKEVPQVITTAANAVLYGMREARCIPEPSTQSSAPPPSSPSPSGSSSDGETPPSSTSPASSSSSPCGSSSS